jgi:adenine-specific DNA-methyltransferase
VDENNTLVERIIDMKKNSQDTTDLENQIDQLVYQLYDLTPEEIEVAKG